MGNGLNFKGVDPNLQSLQYTIMIDGRVSLMGHAWILDDSLQAFGLVYYYNLVGHAADHA